MDIVNPTGQTEPKKPSLFRWVLLTLVVTTLVVGGGGFYFWQSSRTGPGVPGVDKPKPGDKPLVKTADVVKFADADEFRAWLEKAGGAEGGYYGGMMRGRMMAESVAMPMAAPGGVDLGFDSAQAIGLGFAEKSVGEPGRYSETNVQVMGIDEPDIVKTDGKQIYYSPQQRYHWGGIRPMPMIELDGRAADVVESVPPAPGVTVDEAERPDTDIKPMPPRPQPLPVGIRSIKAWPPADLKIDATIPRFGELLLSGKNLLVQTYEGIYGYDVTDPAQPQEKWKMTLENNHEIVSARLYQDKVYLVARAGINQLRPCPIVPMKVGGIDVSIPCGGIYHPVTPTPSDVTYSVMKMDAASGQIEQTASFVGSWQSSAVYMSEKSLYVTHAYNGNVIGFFAGFLRANADLAPAGTVERLEKLESYDISDNAKMVELQTILEQWYASLDQDERLKMENDITNRMDAYLRDHLRDLQKTGVVRVALDGLTVSGSGVIPGHLLNQFSLDEYQGFLRLATTVGGRGTPLSWQFGIGNDDSVNDVYTLDDGMNVAGSVKDLGKGERIYSVRFLQDKGYVVTFKETDPFYVIDLADGRNPQLKGELKIPGYSAYLHPITKDKILGIGKEDNKVKISLFDVADPAAPTEKSKYLLEEYWTDVMNTHHAFLLDPTHEIFFMPGGQGGYVMGYAGDELKLTRAISGVSAKRAVYIEDYLYILGDDKVVVLNEKDWTEVNKLEIPWSEDYPILY